MHSPLCRALIVLITGLTIDGSFAQAETIWQWTHQAEGEGRANVFDGEPVEFDSGSTTGAGDTGMGFFAFDLTRPGVLGARYSTGGESQLFPREEYLLTDLRFSTGYTATSYLGSDRPGGEGDGWIRSVVEVVMPTDEVEWSVALLIEQTSGFSGSTRIRLENVTDGITLFETNERVDSSFLLSDVRGDLMRVTFESEGRGSAPEGLPTMGFYRVIASSVFIIPEPTTVVLLAISIPVVCCRRVRKSRGR